MNSRKLDKILKLREMVKLRSAKKLAASQFSHDKAAEQAQELSSLSSRYCQEHAENPPVNVQELVLFRRFYQQLAYAGAAQDQVVSQRLAVLHQDKFRYLRNYSDAKALAQMLASRDVAHKLEMQRKQRRNHIHVKRPRLV
ncbi:MAG: hypothetical protein GXP16_01390 [Gammaproteobacteria bacterium]|nr:hypothetical protein [Gammaproteobacteria bacterium]